MVDGQSGDVCDYVFGSTNDISNPIVIQPSYQTICLGDSLMLTAIGGDNTYSWPTTSEFNIISPDTVYYTPNTPGDANFNISSFGNNSICATSSILNVNYSAVECVCPILASNNSDGCVSSTFDVSCTDVQGATYQWTGPNGFTSTLQNPTDILPQLTAGTYDYTVTATKDSTTCSSITSVVIDSFPSTSFSYTSTDFCISSSDITPTITGDSNGIFTSSPVGLDLDSITGVISATSSAVESYIVTYTLGETCSVSSKDTVNINSLPIVNSVADQTVCEGSDFSAISFTGTNGASYNWINNNISIGLPSNGTNDISSFIGTGTNLDGSVQVGIIDVTPSLDGCLGEPIQFSLRVQPLSDVTLANLSDKCIYDNAELLVGGLPLGGNYSGTGVSNNTFDPSTGGIGVHTINYSFTNANNCTNYASTTITVDDCASMNELFSNSLIRIYPNPTKGILHVETEGYFTYELTDTHGKVIKLGESNEEAFLHFEKLDIGVYYIKIISSSNSVLQKVIKN